MPFSNTRFAIHAMPIIDPLYTLILIAGLVVAARWAPRTRARLVSACAVFLSTAYLGYGWYLNEAARSFASNQLAQDELPTPRCTRFQPFSRFTTGASWRACRART